MALVPCSLKTLGRPHYHLQMIYFVRNRSFGHMLPAKIQISLCIHAVWSNSSPGAFWLGMDRVSICEQGKVWPDYANAQAILTLRWAHEFICTFFCCFFWKLQLKWWSTLMLFVNSEIPVQAVLCDCIRFIISLSKICLYFSTTVSFHHKWTK